MSTQKVIVFLPAHNEEQSIGEVIPRIARGWDPLVEVEVLVVDDGSTDGTVAVARAAGADHIVSLGVNRGLGSAVRIGLQECYCRGADIAVMIDADNEYPAEQIPELLEPILRGEADYTMGSRFAGTIQGMMLHRRLGNYFFTLIQCILLRRWITDGQSGMRAFSRQAMEHAEIIHDYNYAQVVTLNLVRKGFRLKEIPIRYRFRTKGQSFIKFSSYMSKVVPAIAREMSRAPKKVGIDKNAHAIRNLQSSSGARNPAAETGQGGFDTKLTSIR